MVIRTPWLRYSHVNHDYIPVVEVSLTVGSVKGSVTVGSVKSVSYDREC